MNTPGRTACEKKEAYPSCKCTHCVAYKITGFVISNPCKQWAEFIATALREYARQEVQKALWKAKTECESFHANNDDVHLLARSEALTQAAEIARKYEEQNFGNFSDSWFQLSREIESLRSSPAKEETGEGA